MKALSEFHLDVVAIYGYGVQVSAAMTFWHKWLNKQLSSPTTTPDNSMFFGKSDPNEQDATYVYRRSFSYLLDASSPDGDTNIIHRRNLIALLYASWEDRHRKRIAHEAGLKQKNDLVSDVFGDVRTYRHAIVHSNGRLEDEPEVFHFFRKGQVLALTSEHVDVIFRLVIDDLNRMGKEYFHMDPRFNFEEPMQQQDAQSRN